MSSGKPLPASRNPAYRDHPVVTRARKVFGTNDFDYVEEAVLVGTNKLVLTRPIAYGTLHLPDTNGTVKVFAPRDYLGPLIYIDNPDGDIWWRLHLVRDRPNITARIGKNLITVIESCIVRWCVSSLCSAFRRLRVMRMILCRRRWFAL